MYLRVKLRMQHMFIWDDLLSAQLGYSSGGMAKTPDVAADLLI